MPRVALALLFMLFGYASIASDTLHIIPFKEETIVTDPAKGSNLYRRWGRFPEKNAGIRKIVLHVKFGCPDNMRCADWDYLDFIKIKRAGGVNGADQDFEIARMLTPYGGVFGKDWKFDWEVDITDFSLLLRDSVEIEYNHTGFEPNKDRGWKVTLDFEIIKGMPEAIPVSIQKIYSGSFQYGDDAVSIEEQLKPVTFERKPGADFAKLNVLHTGHGANAGDGCGEFCSKKRMVFFNSELIDARPIWKKCGDNPLYPQAGTWVYDRAHWCPGYLQIPDTYLLPLQGQNVVDINMEPYRVEKTQAVENITAYIVQYKKVVAKHDVTLADILRPTDKLMHSRNNPAAFTPSVIIKNSGKNVLRSLKIVYGTNGFKKKTYNWKGQLAYGKQDTLLLPGLIDGAAGENFFKVALQNPNGKADDFTADNEMAARFMAAPVHSERLVMVIKTNEQPQHNSYRLTDISGKTLYNRLFDSSQRNKVIYDTLVVPGGAYNLYVEDTAGDGLEFWANRRGGSGYLRLQDTKGNLVKEFNPDFGSSVSYAFTTSADSLKWKAVNEDVSVNLYPTSTTGKTTLDFFSGKAEDVTVQIITDEGATLVESHIYKNLKEGSFAYDMSYLPPQRYYVKVFVNGALRFNKRLRVNEARR